MVQKYGSRILPFGKMLDRLLEELDESPAANINQDHTLE
jgi:hypothetical protein